MVRIPPGDRPSHLISEKAGGVTEPRAQASGWCTTENTHKAAHQNLSLAVV